MYGLEFVVIYGRFKGTKLSCFLDVFLVIIDNAKFFVLKFVCVCGYGSILGCLYVFFVWFLLMYPLWCWLGCHLYDCGWFVHNVFFVWVFFLFFTCMFGLIPYTCVCGFMVLYMRARVCFVMSFCSMCFLFLLLCMCE